MDNTKQLTKGEYLVGISFNPGGNAEVAEVKKKAAELIDFIDALRSGETMQTVAQLDQVGRLKSLAITRVEEAAMWAVKAATKPT